MNKTSIEWCDYTWNPIKMRCDRVSEGCRNCWHLRMAVRHAKNPTFGTAQGAYSGETGPRFDVLELDAPLHVKKPAKIAVQLMGDLFHEKISDSTVAAIFHVMFKARKHTFQILTKRPERMRDWCIRRNAGNNPPLSNVWMGVSVEDQVAADKRVPLLLDVPAAVRWVSIEPMIGGVTLRKIRHRDFLVGDDRIDWVVVGGESGPGARPVHPDWVRNLRDQCIDAGIPFMFKQWGEWVPEQPGYIGNQAPNWHLFDGGQWMFHAGKNAAGRELDGKIWDGYPTEVSA